MDLFVSIFSDVSSQDCTFLARTRALNYVAEQIRDEGVLRIVLTGADGVRLERLTVEITGQDEGAIVLRIIPGKAEEGVLGLEIGQLQSAEDLGMEATTAAGERQFRFGERQIIHSLFVVEIRQAV